MLNTSSNLKTSLLKYEYMIKDVFDGSKAVLMNQLESLAYIEGYFLSTKNKVKY